MYVLSITPRSGDTHGMQSLSADISIRPHKLSHTAALINTPHILYCEGIAVTCTAIGYDQVQRFFFLAITSPESVRTKHFKIYGLPRTMQNAILSGSPARPDFRTSTLPGCYSPDKAKQHLRLREWRARRSAFLIAP